MHPDDTYRATAGTRTAPTFARVLAETAIEDAGVLAWRQVPDLDFEVPTGAVEDAFLVDGSRVAVWPAAGSWVAAWAQPGATSVSVVAVPERPTITDAVELARLVNTVVATLPAWLRA